MPGVSTHSLVSVALFLVCTTSRISRLEQGELSLVLSAAEGSVEGAASAAGPARCGEHWKAEAGRAECHQARLGVSDRETSFRG